MHAHLRQQQLQQQLQQQSLSPKFLMLVISPQQISQGYMHVLYDSKINTFYTGAHTHNPTI